MGFAPLNPYYVLLRMDITVLGLSYVAGIGPNTSVGPPGINALGDFRAAVKAARDFLKCSRTFGLWGGNATVPDGI